MMTGLDENGSRRATPAHEPANRAQAAGMSPHALRVNGHGDDSRRSEQPAESALGARDSDPDDYAWDDESAPSVSAPRVLRRASSRVADEGELELIIAGRDVVGDEEKDVPACGAEEETIEDVPRVRRDNHAQNTTHYYQLPPIMISSVRYIVTDSDDEREVTGLGREMSDVFGQMLEAAAPRAKGHQLEDQVFHDALVARGGEVWEPEDSRTNHVAELQRIEAKFAVKPQGASFFERFQYLKRQEFAEASWREYRADVEFAELVCRAQAAYVGGLLERRCRTDLECCSGHSLLRPDRFLADYLTDPGAYWTDPATYPEARLKCQEIIKGTWRCRCYPLKDVRCALESIAIISTRVTMAAVHASDGCELPDDPAKYLASALPRTPVCCATPRARRQGDDAPAARSGRIVGMVLTSSHSPRNAYNVVRAALVRHASGAAQDLSELEMQLEMLGLPEREYGDGESLVCLAATYGDAEALALLYDFGADLSETQTQGLRKQSSLETSASLGHLNVVAFLLQHGGDAAVLVHTRSCA
jgi:hypothetical protein